MLHSFWLELQRRQREAAPAPEAVSRVASQASFMPLSRVRAGRKSAPPRLAPASRQGEVEPEAVPQARAASTVDQQYCANDGDYY